MADLSQYLDVPDAQLQQLMPGVDIVALKEAIRKSQQQQPTVAEPSSKPVTETIKTDPVTGEQTVTISGSPKDLSAANPLTPTIARPVEPTPIPPAIQAYNQYTAQQESGANPNIGYHNPQQGTAYGAYGITAPQYQEIQRANPQFAGRDITSLSPQEQAQANMTSHDVYARQLQAKGVEPTENNIRLAHFLGAGGANQFLKSGAISPEAAAANGGEDKARQIALARLNGPVNPNQPRPPMIAGTASSDVGLTPTEQAIAQMSKTPGFNPTIQQEPVPAWHQAIMAAGNNPAKLFAIADSQDPNIPEEARVAARNKGVEAAIALKGKNDAGGIIQAGLAGDDQEAAKKLMNELRSKNEGSWVRALLLQGAGLHSAADREFQKLEGGKYSQTFIDGKSLLVQTSPDGSIVKAWDSAGKELNDKQLVKVNTEALGPGKLDVVGGTYVSDTLKDKNGNALVGRVVTNKNTGISYIQTDEGLKPMAGFRPQSSTGSLADMRARQIQQLNLELQGKTAEEQMRILRERNTALVGAGFEPIQPNEIRLQAPQIGGGQSAPSGAVQPVPPSAAPAGQPAPSGAVQPVPPGQQAPAQPPRRPTTAELATRSEIAKKGGDILASESEWLDKLDVIDEGIKGAKGKNNLGTIDTGILPGERFLGRTFRSGAVDTRNTDAALNAVKTVSAAGMKTLGANPTDADRDYLTKNIPDETWDGKDVAEWLESRKKFVQRKIDMAREQVESGGQRNKPEAAPGTKENPIKLKI